MSSRDKVTWHGYWPAAPTPFTAEGDLDLDRWQQLLDLYVTQGVHGVLVNGTTGEWFSQTAGERATLARTAAETVAGRVPVVVGISAYTAAEAAALGREAADAGVDGLLTTVPPYVHPAAAETRAYVAAVAAATDLPLMVYNWPRGVAVDLPVELLGDLADIDGVVAIKESSGDELKAIRVVEELGGRLRVFTRLVYRRGLAVMRELGGDGSIDGGGVGAPFAVAFFEAAWRGDWGAARLAADRYSALVSSLVGPDYGSLHGSPTAQVKALMRLLGQPGGFVRPPLLDLEAPEVLADLADRLAASGLVAELQAEDRLKAALQGSYA